MFMVSKVLSWVTHLCVRGLAFPSQQHPPNEVVRVVKVLRLGEHVCPRRIENVARHSPAELFAGVHNRPGIPVLPRVTGDRLWHIVELIGTSVLCDSPQGVR